MTNPPLSALTNLVFFVTRPLFLSLTAAFLLGGITQASAQETAYQALRTIGNLRDSSYYERLIMVIGRAGEPQPRRWTLLFHDQTVRGQLREIQVEGGSIVGETTPNIRDISPRAARLVMDLRKLNLNSDGAFQITNQEAIRARFGFDGLNFTLRAQEVNNAPAWTVEYLDTRGRGFASILISAENGQVLRQPVPPARRGASTSPGRSSNLESTGTLPPPPPHLAHDDGILSRTGRTMDRAGVSLERGLTKVGSTVERFFTGRIGQPE